MYSFDDVPHSLQKSMHSPIRQAGRPAKRRKQKQPTWTATCQVCDKCMSRHPRLAAEEPQVIQGALDANQPCHFSLSQEPPLKLSSRPPKMYSPSAAADQVPTPSRAVGGEPLGVICCQAPPCVAKKTGNHVKVVHIS